MPRADSPTKLRRVRRWTRHTWWLGATAVATACAGQRAPLPSEQPSPLGSASSPSPSSSTPLAAASGGSVEAALPPPKIATIAPEEGVGLVAGPQGHVGAWLALGPFRLPEKDKSTVTALRLKARKPNGVIDEAAPAIDDHAFAPKFGAAVPTRIDVPSRELGKDGKPKDKIKGWSSAAASWSVVSARPESGAAIDLEHELGSGGKPTMAYLAATLRLPIDDKLLFTLAVDDGVELIVDGVSRFSRDASRALRDDDDLIPLDLSAGDHVVVLKLHQRDGGWGARVRLLDRATLKPPIGARWLLPGADAATGSKLLESLAAIRITRAPSETGYALTTSVRFPEGAVTGTPLTVKGALLDAMGTPKVALHELGAATISPRTVDDFHAEVAATDLSADESAGADLTVRVMAFGRTLDVPFHPRLAVRQAIVRARKLVATWKKEGRPAAIPDDVEATLAYLEARLAGFVSRGDDDVKSQLADAADLVSLLESAEVGKDPLATKTGALRLAHFARADGEPQPFTLYVPENPGGKKLPLHVGLHGMNGGPMSMLRIFFGGDDEGKTMSEMERRFEAVQTTKLASFVLAPHAHGNAMYRQLGEEEVMDLIEWAKKRFPTLDADRVYMTGFSMGGIGAASIPLHHPDVFAAAQPLCGYHSYAIRRDIHGRPLRPWEEFLIEDRSNTEWAANGMRLPLYVVHGIHDLPEENSGVLIDAYEKFGFPIKHEHPDKGHDVWGWAYDHLDQVKWFAGRRRDPHPKHVRLRTTRPRFGDDAWLHVDALTAVDGWGSVDAKVENKKSIVVKTKGVDGLHLDREPELMDAGELTVAVDGAKISFASGAPIVLHRTGGAWASGPIDDPKAKSGKISGPIRDVWNEPLTFVYGASDPTQTTANHEVAQALARLRWGVDVNYPLVADDAVDPAAVPTRSMVLVGNAKSNRVLRALEAELPMQIDGNTIRFAGQTYTGAQLGAAFVVPHPRARDKYLLVVEGVDALGTWRSLSLPELLPDFVVFDENLAPARGQQVLSFGTALAAGFFDKSWKAPASLGDPMAGKLAPAAKGEKDATSYLP